MAYQEIETPEENEKRLRQEYESWLRAWNVAHGRYVTSGRQRG